MAGRKITPCGAVDGSFEVGGTRMMTGEMRYQGCMLGMAAGDALGAAIELSGKSSITTHGASTCIDACRYFGFLK